jgi:hypothetical protein
MAKKRKASAWARLPNAALIDDVLADAKARPDAWVAAWRAINSIRVSAARQAARIAVRDAARGAERSAVWDAAQGVARVESRSIRQVVDRLDLHGVVWLVGFALVAWDDCAHLLDLPSTTLRTMMDLCDAPACHQAVLLLPYVLVKEGTPTDLT